MMTGKFLGAFLIMMTVKNFCYCQKNTVSTKFLIEKISNNNYKGWYRCGTLAKVDKMPGDKRYVFSRSDMKFTIQTLNHLLKWETDTTYSWTIKYESENSPTGFHHYNLIIGGQYAYFNFANDFKTMFLKLPRWNERLCLN
jgi:hypothetical protein